ncbi:MAG: B12-binding domain-containing radical SAM protein [Lachnospiraceae bacterium]|nr:B12-binding domain-containing radical SAM protein [Lachnospiraceae bacterium]
MKTKILLINLPCYLTMKDFVDNDFNYNPSLGLLALSEYVSLFGFEAKVIDYNFGEIDYAALEEMICEEGFGVVGVTVYTENLNLVLKFVKKIRKIDPRIKVMAGGPHATLKPDEIIKSRYVDFVMAKDGEASLLELMMYLEYGEKCITEEHLEGVISKRCRNRERENVTDLSLLPIINREHAEIDRFKNLVTLYSSKGCPGRCIYCAATFISGAKYRVRDVYSIFLECWLIFHQCGQSISGLFFIDDIFTVQKTRTKEFCRLIREYEFPIYWSCESRIDVINEESIDMLAESKCCAIQFGVESGDQEILDIIGKHIRLDHLEKIVSYAAQYELRIHLGFMLGHYPDTEETMRKTLDFIRKMLKINGNINYSVSINTPFPGTWQYEHADEIGLEITDHDYSHYDLITPVIRTEHFDEAMLRQLYQESGSLRTENAACSVSQDE